MQQPEWIAELIVFLGGLIDRYGLLGIAAAMFAESAGVPFASAVVIATAGSLIFSGKFPSGQYCSLRRSDNRRQHLQLLYWPGQSNGRFNQECPVGGQTGRINQLGRVNQKYMRCGKIRQLLGFHGASSGGNAHLYLFPAGAMHMNILLFIIYTALGGALFSLTAIGTSLLLTRFMGLILSYLRYLLSLSPWLWAGCCCAWLF